MSDIVIASGFSMPWDGNFTRQKLSSHWVHASGDYWIWRDSKYWYLSASPYQYTSIVLKARKNIKLELTSKNYGVHIIDPKGNYDGMNGNPNGMIS